MLTLSFRLLQVPPTELSLWLNRVCHPQKASWGILLLKDSFLQQRTPSTDTSMHARTSGRCSTPSASSSSGTACHPSGRAHRTTWRPLQLRLASLGGIAKHEPGSAMGLTSEARLQRRLAAAMAQHRRHSRPTESVCASVMKARRAVRGASLRPARARLCGPEPGAGRSLRSRDSGRNALLLPPNPA